MKKSLIACTILSAILLAACKNDMLEITDANDAAFVASIEEFENNAQTKTSLSAQNSVVWNEGDQITIFQGAPVGSRFEVDQSCDGSSSGAFNPVQAGTSQGSGFTSVMEMAANVAVYPYNEQLGLIDEPVNDSEEKSYTVTNVTIPAVQEYLENSFPKGTFAMVAVTESATDKVLKFKNVLGAIKLQLLGDCKVKSIKIEGNNNEVLSGNAKITAFKGAYSPAITMLEEQSTSITLNCQEGVQLNPDNATSFILAVPPTNFEDGFTVTITDTEDNEKVLNTTATNTVQRSYILKMPKLNISHMNGGEELDYILFEDELVEELCINAFDTNNDGKLQLTEAAAVTDIRPMSLKDRSIKSFNEFRYFTSVKYIAPEYFKDQAQLSNIILPQSVESIGTAAFSGCSSLKKISIPDGVETIAANTFMGCASMTDIVMPESVVIIDEYAFSGCSSLKNIDLHEGIRDIRQYAFENCSSITSIVIPDSYSNNTFVGYTDSFISNGTFSGCTSLASVTMPDNITDIGSYAFYNCISLVHCDIPKSVDIIGSSAFSGCKSLEEFISESDSFQYINDNAFKGCSSLSKVVFGEPAYYNGAPLRKIEIGESAFADCESLVEVDFNDNNVKTLGVYMFSGCTSLREVKFSDNCTFTAIPEHAFSGCSSLEQINILDAVSVIGKYAFENCNSLKKVTGASVVTVEEKAFSGCTWLKEVGFMSNVTSIGNYAFENCALLNGITLNSSITQIPVGAFSGCSNLSLTLLDGVTTLGYNSFRECKSVTLASTTTSIAEGALYRCMDVNIVYNANTFPTWEYDDYLDDCISLNVTIPEGVTEIKESMFRYRKSLQNVYIPNTVTSIGNMAFADCSSLKVFDIPESIKSLGDRVFENCSALKEVKIPETVTTLGASIFYNCISLKEVELPSNLKELPNYTFRGCISLGEIQLPESLEKIGNYAFYGCASLGEIQLPESLEKIGNYAFYECASLKSITLPSKIQSIGRSAFSDCSQLANIYCLATIVPQLEPIGDSYYTFDGNAACRIIHVPAGSVVAYQNADGWKKYQDFIQAMN